MTRLGEERKDVSVSEELRLGKREGGRSSLRRGHQLGESFRPRLSVEIEHILVVVRSFVEILGLPRVENTAIKRARRLKVNDAT